MEYTTLGRTGLQVSRICLGCMTYGSPTWQAWVLDEEASLPSIQRAWEAGINFFDTADVYSLGRSEEILGAALRTLNIRREEVVIASKVYFAMSGDRNDRGLSRKHIHHAVDASLKRLGVEYIDLYQIHRFDRLTDIEVTLEALGDLVRAGKVLHLGASSMFAWQFARMLFTADRLGVPRFVTMQNHYNLIYREEEREMIPLCRAEGIAMLPWSPLARGFLAGNRKRGTSGTPADRGDTARAQSDCFAADNYFTDNDFEVVDRVIAVAAERETSPARVALAWILSKPGVVAPIVGTTKPAHLDDAVAALDLRLTEDEVRRLEAPYRPHPVLGHSYENPTAIATTPSVPVTKG